MQKVKKFLLESVDTVSLVWGKLPKELKVAIYVSLSFGIAQTITQLEGIKQGVDPHSVFVVLGINIVLVFLKELKDRIIIVKKKFSK